jgi:diaminopimelate epimerase
MSGCGNDFIIIDNRNHIVKEDGLAQFVQKVCRRKMSVGADGLILIENSATADFRWRFFNLDGNRAGMCGNGARCAARFAYIRGICRRRMSFETDAGVIFAEVSGEQVKIRVTDPFDLQLDYAILFNGRPLTVSSINTGVPHVVVMVDDVEDTDVVHLGRKIRYHAAFSPEGANVNFVSLLGDQTFAVRTYERGVEDETLACGTGAVAVAMVLKKKLDKTSPLKIKTKSGRYLSVYIQNESKNGLRIYLEGDARLIYQGQLGTDAWIF